MNSSSEPRISVASIDAVGIHHRFSIHHEFTPGINIIYGANGAGKTTLLHIISNALSGDFARFSLIDFEQICIRLSNGSLIAVTQEGEGDRSRITASIDDREVLRVTRGETRLLDEQAPESPSAPIELLSRVRNSPKPLPAAYFPAFRTMIEAWSSANFDEPIRGWRSYEATARSRRATQAARQLFGGFVPTINFPSPTEIEMRLSDEIRKATLAVGSVDRALLSRTFVNVFAVLVSESHSSERSPDGVLEEIRRVSERLENIPVYGEISDEGVYAHLRSLLNQFRFRPEEQTAQAARILDVYLSALATRVEAQENSFKGVEQYLTAVNNFLTGKSIRIRAPGTLGERVSSRQRLIELAFDNGPATTLSALSSGERQIATLLYASSRMSGQSVVLVDEPELSLHVDWQRLLLPRMAEQLGQRQIITCTHSPVIAGEYEMSELRAEPYESSKALASRDELDEEENE